MKAAIFDLDGTLIDSMKVWDTIGEDFLARRGISMPDDVSRTVKDMTFLETAQYYKKRFLISDMSAPEIFSVWKQMVYREYANNIPMKRGAVEYLQKLRANEVKLAIATATDNELVKAVLSRHGIFDVFDAIVTVDDVGKGKNYPDIFLLAAQKLAVKPDECLVFEDCLRALIGAKKAGMRVYIVFDESSAFEKDVLKSVSDKYINSFDELIGD